MSFGDWDHFTFENDGAAATSLDVSTPIIGSGSLFFSNSTAGASANSSWNSHLNSGFTRGLTKGRIRYITKFGSWVDTGTFLDNVGTGVYYLCDTLDISNSVASFYFAGVVRDRNTAGSIKPVVAKTSSAKTLVDLDWEVDVGVGVDALYSSASSITGVVAGDTLPIQVEWNVDIAGLGGVRHILSVGSIGETTFGGLSVIYDIVESGSPFTTSTIEGVGYMVSSASGPTSAETEQTIDDTGVFQLV